jgi:hypothetical protein
MGITSLSSMRKAMPVRNWLWRVDSNQAKHEQRSG